MRVLIITTMRNEGPFLLEWIAYHRLIGVTDFLIYSNDCDDGTDEMLDRLAELGLVVHERNARSGKKTVQWKALNRAKNHPLTKSADWIMVTDVDEFWCIHSGDGRLADLFTAHPEADGFVIPWRMFGHNGQVAFRDAPVTRQFTACAPEALIWPWRAVQFKTLFRNRPGTLKRLGVHRPELHDSDPPPLWLDGNGQPMRRVPGTILPQTTPRYGLAQINHYALGSIESFLVKADRGRPNHSHDPIELAYWIDRDFNQVGDRRILRHDAELSDALAELRQDARLGALHRASVAWRQDRIAALKAEPEWFYLFARIRQQAPTRLLPMPEQIALFNGLIRIRQRLAREKQASQS